MSEEPTIKEKIDKIMQDLESGVIGESTKDMNDRHAEIDRLAHLCSTLRTPLDLLNEQRFHMVGEILYTTTRESMNSDGYPRKTLPVMTLDSSKLFELLSLLNRMGVLYKAISTDPLVRNSEGRMSSIRLLYASRGLEHGDVIDKDGISILTGLMQSWTESALENVGLSLSSTLRSLLADHDDKAMGEIVHQHIDEAWTSDEMRPVYDSLSSALFSWSRDPEERSASQKGKGIQVLSEASGSTIWHTAPSVFITLDTAKTASTAELLATLDIVPIDNHYNQATTLGDVIRGISTHSHLYIRTCPASPRPGVLPNIKAGNISEFVEGVRYLANAMSDPDHPDYDPQGELCVMMYMESDLSGVLVKGHQSMVVGLGSSGVTAGEGSNLIIPLHEDLSIAIEDTVFNIMSRAPDGHEHHELELVWPKNDPNGSYGDGIDCERIINKAGYMESNRMPVITQIRGLGKPKPELKAPATYLDEETGELVTMTIRGNVPHGVVSQAHYEDVGKGDLSDCAKLEADIKSGVIVEGQKDFVIYCPSGSTNCHAAGVANDHALAIVYAPVQQDATWTEVDGWVTTATGVEPAPYDSAPFTSYFFDGCRDGDRNWDYGYHPLSQFFHSFINSPYNDPRFEAYLAGFYSTWIIKATLAVALGECRHGYASQAKFNLKAGLLPLLLLEASGCLHKFPYGPVGEKKRFYDTIRLRELGLEGMRTCLRAVRECFVDPIYWASSYGGKRYRESIDKAIDAVDSLIDLQNGGDLNKVLGTVNILENAVHNCSYFFDKFVSAKTYFDIGTSNHRLLGSIPQQFMTIVPLHQHFYNHVLDPSESHKVATEANDDQNIAVRNMMLRNSKHCYHYNKHVLQTLDKLTDMPSNTNGADILAGDYGSRAKAHVEKVVQHMSKLEDTPIHKVGLCVFDECGNESCQHNKVEAKFGISTEKMQTVQLILGQPSYTHHYVYPPTIYKQWKAVEAPNSHDTENTVFTQPSRETTENKKPILLDISHITPNGVDIQGLQIEEASTPVRLNGISLSKGDSVYHEHVVVEALMTRVREYMEDDDWSLSDALIYLLSGTNMSENAHVFHDFFGNLYGDMVEMYLNPTHLIMPSELSNEPLRTILRHHIIEESHTMLTKYLLTLWLSEQIIINDGWDVNPVDYGDVSYYGLGAWKASQRIWTAGTRTEYHAKGVAPPSTVFTGHTVNQLLQVLMSAIDIDTLREIMEEYI